MNLWNVPWEESGITEHAPYHNALWEVDSRSLSLKGKCTKTFIQNIDLYINLINIKYKPNQY